ncbi:MAG TPA: hypothetical protein VGM54_21225 [Chthoniobacter sp.]
MGLPPFPALQILALAGLPNDLAGPIDQIGWFLPFFAITVPVGLIAAVVFARAGYVILGVAQIAGIAFGLRALRRHLRHSGFSRAQIRMALYPSYLIACFLTNIAVLISIGLAHKFF